MKIFKFAIFWSLSLGGAAFAADYDLPRIVTKTGKIYQQVRILDADEYGLLFRHNRGVAKESYPFLSSNIRDMFEPVDEIPSVAKMGLPLDKGGVNLVSKDMPVTKALMAAAKAMPGAKELPAPAVTIPNLTLTLVVRQPVNQYPVSFWNKHPNPHNWPSHWHRFHSAHYLTNPVFREAATRNFLHATGLLPKPRRVLHRPVGHVPIRFW